MLLPAARHLLHDADIVAPSNGSVTAPSPALGTTRPPLNYTGLVLNVVDDIEDDVEQGFTDMETVVLACITTLVTLVFALIAGFCVRFLWRKFRERTAEGYEGVLQRDESSDPLAVKSLTASGNLLTDELKTSESQFSVTPAEELEEMTSQSPLLSYGASSGSLQNHPSKNANGSIITMTLKNNHLIVETEERGVCLEDNTAKTTTKFNQNSVFVVEVQHSVGVPVGGSNVSDSASLYPKLSSTVSSQEDIDETDEDIEGSTRRSSSQKAQIHHPPDIEIDEDGDSEDDDLEDVDEEVEDDEEDEDGVEGRGGIEQRKYGSTNTGLSQSDLSISSAGSNNPSYRYGNQLLYEGGHFGYPEYAGYTTGDEIIPPVVITMPQIKSQAPCVIQKPVSATTRKANFNNPRNSIEILPDGGLFSDIQARERSKKHIQDAEDDVHQEEQRKLGIGTTKLLNGREETMQEPNGEVESALHRKGILPSRLDKDTTNDVKTDGANNDDKTGEHYKPEGTRLHPVTEDTEEKKYDNVSAAKKRGSLPIITPDLYKQTKNLILDKTSIQRSSLSPKFERLRNEVSPLDEVEKSPQNEDNSDMDSDGINSSDTTTKTIKNEYENKAFVSSDQHTS